MDPKKRKMLIWYLSVCLLVSIVAFVYWFILWRHREYTNDAYVEGNQVYITPLHSGFLTAIHTDDTFLVKQGQLLIELDETDAKIGLDRAKEHLANTA